MSEIFKKFKNHERIKVLKLVILDCIKIMCLKLQLIVAFYKFLNRFVIQLFIILPFATVAQSQGFNNQGFSASDLNALKGLAGFQGGAQSAGGATFLPTLMPITMSNLLVQDEVDTNTDGKKVTKPTPLRPNEFQQYVAQTTGQIVPLFGAEFFENLYNSNAQFSRIPVSDDYSIGAGDQLLIRIWGSTSSELNITVDRQGAIAIPKLGTIKLAGVKASQLDAVVKAFLSKFYKDIEVSVTLGKIRKITVFVVGQAIKPGSYSLTGQSTLTSALFASGGPNQTGSLRNIQLIRQGRKVADFDLYDFLSKGDKSKDVLLQDGDVLLYTKAMGFMAVIGKVNTPYVFELKGQSEVLNDVLLLMGGLPITADPRRAVLDRVKPTLDQLRIIENIELTGSGTLTLLKNGDVLTVYPSTPNIANAITVRGAVSQPTRVPWKPGIRVSDVITHKSFLISPENIREKNELLFSKIELELAARNRAKIPAQLAVERMLMEKQKLEEESLKAIQNGAVFKKPETASAQLGVDPNKATFQEQSEREIAIAQLGKPEFSDENLVDRIGQLRDSVNLEYAVIERYSMHSMQITLLPFKLGQVLMAPKGEEDLMLEAGDVITVFSSKDLQMPVSKIKAFIRIEGEVNRPGVYEVQKNDNLQSIIVKAGGLTPEAFIFATGLFREEVRKSQLRNMEKLLRKMEAESSASVAQITQSAGASLDPTLIQAKVNSVQQTQKLSLQRFKQLKPEGRISLNITPKVNATVADLPNLRLENLDRVYIPPRPDFVQVFGSVNTESALIYQSGLTVKDYVNAAGLGGSADVSGAILVRANGTAMTNQSLFGNDVLSAVAMPGDSIVMPEKFDRESSWSQALRNAKDFTQVLYQLGLGAAAIKTLRQ